MAYFDALALDCALTAAGRIARVTNADGTFSYRPLIHLCDNLGNVRTVVDGGTVNKRRAQKRTRTIIK